MSSAETDEAVRAEREACAEIVNGYGATFGTGPSNLDPIAVRAIAKVCEMIMRDIRSRE